MKMTRIKKEYEDYSYDEYKITEQDLEEEEWEKLLPSHIEYEFDKLSRKKKIRLTGKYKEKRYIP